MAPQRPADNNISGREQRACIKAIIIIKLSEMWRHSQELWLVKRIWSYSCSSPNPRACRPIYTQISYHAKQDLEKENNFRLDSLRSLDWTVHMWCESSSHEFIYYQGAKATTGMSESHSVHISTISEKKASNQSRDQFWIWLAWRLCLLLLVQVLWLLLTGFIFLGNHSIITVSKSKSICSLYELI
jgi:hypothetical protein